LVTKSTTDDDLVTKETSDSDWARQVFVFRVGSSEMADRLEAIQKWIGGQEKLSAASGMSVSAVKAWRMRGTEMGLGTAETLSRNTGLSLDYIARGDVRTTIDIEVEMLRFDLAKQAFPIPSSGPARKAARNEVISEAQRRLDELALQLAGDGGGGPANDNVAMLPRYDIQASAGHGRQLSEPVPEMERVPFRRDWLRERGINPAHAEIVTNRGDSMEPDIEDGAPMLLDTEKGKQIYSGCIYVIVLEGDVLVKRVSRNVDGTIDLISSNPLYPKQTITQDRLDRLTIAGRVHWTGRWL
jgi:phage repressor protein C with HTH and peptisase S24 domain